MGLIFLDEQIIVNVTNVGYDFCLKRNIYFGVLIKDFFFFVVCYIVLLNQFGRFSPFFPNNWKVEPGVMLIGKI